MMLLPHFWHAHMCPHGWKMTCAQASQQTTHSASSNVSPAARPVAGQGSLVSGSLPADASATPALACELGASWEADEGRGAAGWASTAEDAGPLLLEGAGPEAAGSSRLARACMPAFASTHSLQQSSCIRTRATRSPCLRCACIYTADPHVAAQVRIHDRLPLGACNSICHGRLQGRTCLRCFWRAFLAAFLAACCLRC